MIFNAKGNERVVNPIREKTWCCCTKAYEGRGMKHTQKEVYDKEINPEDSVICFSHKLKTGNKIIINIEFLSNHMHTTYENL